MFAFIQFPVPINAPTTGDAAFFFWACMGIAVIIIALVGAIKFLFAPGSQRLVERRKADNDAITILQKQVVNLEQKVTSLEREVKRMAIAEERNRNYRHALANQANALLAWAEVAHNLFELIFEEWKDVPHHFHRQVEQMGHPARILERHPLPKEREVTEEDLDREDIL